jgi:hypothetical protein
MMAKTIKVLVLLFSVLFFSQCDKALTVSNELSVFSVQDYCNEIKNESGNIPVIMISGEGALTDSLFIENYKMDSILNVIRTFDISKKGKGSFYRQEVFSEKDKECSKYIADREDLKIRFLDVCFENGSVAQLVAEKRQKTLINSLYQRIEFLPQASFSLHTSLINRWKRDTVINNTTIYFKTNKSLHKNKTHDKSDNK